MANVKSITKGGKGAETTLDVCLGKLGRGLKRGDSVSINGACLTVIKKSKGNAEFEMVAETIRRTNLGRVKPGDKVNIERSMKVGDRLEGHFVLGHVDGTGIVEDFRPLRSETKIWIRLNKEMTKSLVSKGSIAVDGVSLTIVDIKDDLVSVSLIPHTLTSTTLGFKQKGDTVNIEIDILGKYVTSNLRKRSSF